MKHDLEERTLEFTKRVIKLCRSLPKNSVNFSLIDQLMKSAGFIGADYRESVESLSKKDLLHKLKISRKEAKETVYWLELIIEANLEIEKRTKKLLEEAIEIKKILLSIIIKRRK